MIMLVRGPGPGSLVFHGGSKIKYSVLSFTHENRPEKSDLIHK